MSLETTLDRFGRIILPKETRRRLGLEPGTVLEVEEEGEEIRLKPVRGEPNMALKKGVLVFRGKPTGDIEGALRSHREERLRREGPRASR